MDGFHGIHPSLLLLLGPVRGVQCIFGGVYEFGYELLGVRNSQSVSVIRPRSEITKVIPLNYSGLVIFGGFNLESIVVEILSFS